MKLFQPDNFSKTEIHFNEYVGDQKLLLKVVAEYFEDFEIKTIYQVDRVEIQTQNYKVVLIHSGEEKIILLKKYKVSPDPEQTEFYLGLLDSLFHRGVVVSQVIKTLNGKLTTTIDNEIYSVFNFIEGDHFVPTEKCFAEAAVGMAKMHLAFNEFDAEYLTQIEILSQKGYYPFNVVKEYSERDLSLFEEKIRAKNKKEEMEEVLLANLPVFKKAAREVEKNKEQIEKLPKQMVHSDFHPHNVLMKDGQLTAIIDFENVRINQQARDIAFAIYKFGRQFLVGSNMMDKDKAHEASGLKDLFLNSYSQIKPLSDEERELLPVLAKDTFVRKLLFVFKGVYEEGNNIWINDLPKHAVAIDEIEYFFGP